jgi:TolA-binding protein
MQIRPAGIPAQPDFPSFASAKERSDAAKKQFQEIVDKYPHTRTADMARYMLGVTAASAGDNAAAESSFKTVAANGGKELASVAKLALAALYGNTNRTKDAVAQLQLAELYQNSNQPLDAKRLYEEIKKENPGPEAVQIATQKLAALK